MPSYRHPLLALPVAARAATWESLAKAKLPDASITAVKAVAAGGDHRDAANFTCIAS